MVSTYSRIPIADAYPSFDLAEPEIQPLSRSVVMNRNKLALQVAGQPAFETKRPPLTSVAAAHNSYLQSDSSLDFFQPEVDLAVPGSRSSAAASTLSDNTSRPFVPSLPSLSVPSLSSLNPMSWGKSDSATSAAEVTKDQSSFVPSLPSLSVPSLSSLNPMSWGKSDSATTLAPAVENPAAPQHQPESFFKRLTPPNLSSLNPMSWGMFGGSPGNERSDAPHEQQQPSFLQRISPNNLSSLNPMSWGQANNGASPVPESSAPPPPQIPASSIAASTVDFDGSSDVVGRSVTVREMAAKFDAGVPITGSALTVTAAVVHQDMPNQDLHLANSSDPHSHNLVLSELPVQPLGSQIDVVSVVIDAPAHVHPVEMSNHPESSQANEAKRHSLPHVIIEEIMQEDPLMPSYTPPEVEISPPPFSYSDIHNVDPRGLTYCYLAAEYVNGVIKKRVLKINSPNRSVSLYNLGGKNQIWSFHFSQLKEVQSSDNDKEWDEALPTDSVVLVPHSGMHVIVMMCYPVDSISLRLCLNSELTAFRAFNSLDNTPTRSAHGLRCLLHEGKAYSGSSTRSWNSRVLSVYCGRVYVLNSFSDIIPADIIDMLGCRVESSAQAPCQLMLHAAISYTFTFTSPKVRDVFVNALKQAKTMYETSVTQYSEYCRGMRLLTQQNLMYAMDLKRTVLREQLKLENVSMARNTTPKLENVSMARNDKISTPLPHVPLEGSTDPHIPTYIETSTLNAFPSGNGPAALLKSYNAPSDLSGGLHARHDDVSGLPEFPRVAGPALFDQASNLSTSSSAAEHNIALRLSQKYASLRAVEFGAPMPRPLSVQGSAGAALIDLLQQDPALHQTLRSAPLHQSFVSAPLQQSFVSAPLQQSFVSTEFPVNSVNLHSNFATILPHLVVAVAPMSLNLLAADILSNYGHSSKLYLFDVVDAAAIHNKFPVLHNASFVFDKDHPPSLASICMFVADVVEFMAQSPSNTVVLRCSDGFRRCCVMASALLLQLGELAPTSNLDELHITALDFYYHKRGRPQASDEFLSPSQIRFVKFFSDCLNAGIVTPSGISRQALAMRIESVSLEMPLPCEDIIVRILSNGLTWDSASSSQMFVDPQGACVCPVDFRVVDDVIVAIYSSNYVKPVASLAFHTLFLPPESHTMVLPLEELDLQSLQPDPRLPFQVRVVTSPSVTRPIMPASAGQSPYASFEASIISSAVSNDHQAPSLYDA